MKSETPRTDQIAVTIAAGDWRKESDCTDCALDHARQLERELTAAQQALSSANAMIESYKTGDAMLLELLPGHATIAEGIHALKQSLSESQQENQTLRSEVEALNTAFDKSQAREAGLREAAEPFRHFASWTVEQDSERGYTWKGTAQKDRLVDWFGPTDFGTIQQALTTPPMSVAMVPWSDIEPIIPHIVEPAHNLKVTLAIRKLRTYAPQPKENP